MTKLEAITLTFMQIPMAEDRRTELHKRVKEAEEEQAEVIAALRECVEQLSPASVPVVINPGCEPFSIKVGRELLARFPSPAPSGPTG
jgi:hypothetical protein